MAPVSGISQSHPLLPIRRGGGLYTDLKKQVTPDPDIHRGIARKRVQTELQGVDGAVKAHEKTHMAILGGAAGSGIQYTYIRGPDGSRYAVGGSIKVDMSPVPGNPAATIDKARRIRLAALAPGNPSAADMRTAAKAYRMEKEAREELREMRESDTAEKPGFLPADEEEKSSPLTASKSDSSRSNPFTAVEPEPGSIINIIIGTGESV